MTDENLESNLPDGSAGSPNPNTSQGQGVQPPSSFDAEKLLKQLEPLIEKKVQSVKDRRIAELEKTVSGIQPVLERFKGLVPDDKLREIQKDLEFEDLKRRVYGSEQTSAPVVSGNTQSDAAGELAKVIDEGLELPPNDSRVTDLKLKYGSDPVTYLREGLKLSASFKTNPPSPAEQLPPTGSAPSGGKSIEALTADYQKDMLAARGDRNKLRAIKDKAIKDGVQVDRIAFV